MSKCSMVIKTRSLKFDDRLRKECLSLRDNNIEPRIVVLTQENKKESSTTDYGVSYNSISLIGRNIFPHKRFLIFKIIEMNIRFFTDILRNRSEIVWVHNMELAGVIPLIWILKKVGFIKKIIWDQHELPIMSVLPQGILHKIYTLMCLLSDKIITANEPRKKHVEQYVKHPDKIVSLENYPDKQFIDLERGVLPDKAQEWLGNKEFLLAQGGANPKRHLETLVEAVIKNQTNKLIIVGPYSEDQPQKLHEKWGEDFDKYILFYGAVPQMSLIDFIDHAKASVIFYEKSSLNRWLCAPNRLYQALGRGIPVIVGSNPPMSELVNRFECGIAIKDDGGSAKNIQQGIEQLMARYDEILENVQACKETWVWGNQHEAFQNMFPDSFQRRHEAVLYKRNT